MTPKFRTINVTRFEFFVKGKSEKKMQKIVNLLRELNIGYVSMEMGRLEKQTSVEFVNKRAVIYSTDLGKFIGIKSRWNEYSGEWISTMAPRKK